jgi:predicted lipoprotein with Yx(FWY)xxD motif
MRRRIIRWLPLLVLAAAAGTGAAMAATASTHATGTVRMAKLGSFGSVLVGPTGRTLYRYTLDSKHVNKCSGNPGCNPYWPPLLVPAGAKPSAGAGVSAALLGTLKIPHGKVQVTYAGYPLYYFAQDKKAGQANGEGFDNQWYVVNAKAALVKKAAETGSSGGGSGSGGSTTTSSGGEAWG